MFLAVAVSKLCEKPLRPPSSDVCRHFVGVAIELRQGLSPHLEFHLEILFGDLGIGLTEHLGIPFVRHAADTQASRAKSYTFMELP